MRPRLAHPPWILLAAGLALAGVAAALALTHRGTRTVVRTVTVTLPATTTAPPAQTSPPPPTTPPTTTAPPPTTTAPLPPPTPVAMSWQHAGGIVSHTSAVDPAWLGQQMRTAGFGWVAVFLGENDSVTPPDTSWISRFEAASGLPVGGWSVLGEDPAGDAAQAAQLIRQDGLAFYIADAEAPYGYTDGTTQSNVRLSRSRAFVAAFRAAEPSLPAAVSSYCRPDEHDLDWNAWAKAGFAFLPQAYVNDFGAAASPATCADAASSFFPRSEVHPTVGSYQGVHGFVAPDELTRLLAAAHTSGFSIYPAEVGMSAEDWQAYGRAIADLHIARPVA